MKKCIAFCLAVILFIGSVVSYNEYLNGALSKRVKNLLYNNSDAKQHSITAISKSLDTNTMLVLGSSELNPCDIASFPAHLFKKGNSDFNMSFIGYGSYCSLQHALYVGALSKHIKNGKVVLIVSPQWFENNYLSSDAFSSRYTKNAFDEFINNSQISKDTKQQITNRCITMLQKDPSQQKIVKLYNSVYLKGSLNIFDRLYLFTDRLFTEVKTKHDAIRYVKRDKAFKAPPVKAESIDFDQLMVSEEQDGKANSTNNQFYISDSYYNKNISYLEGQKNAATGKTYLDSSPEYGDLRLFLQVCKETGIKPLLISVPFNGYYYDYMNFSQSERQKYYQNIRNIANEYGVSLADFSGDEYTKYFFMDIWHIGWKGWTALDKSIYQFYKEDNTSSAQ